jgi:hypothetical protein
MSPSAKIHLASQAVTALPIAPENKTRDSAQNHRAFSIEKDLDHRVDKFSTLHTLVQDLRRQKQSAQISVSQFHTKTDRASARTDFENSIKSGTISYGGCGYTEVEMIRARQLRHGNKPSVSTDQSTTGEILALADLAGIEGRLSRAEKKLSAAESEILEFSLANINQSQPQSVREYISTATRRHSTAESLRNLVKKITSDLESHIITRTVTTAGQKVAVLSDSEVQASKEKLLAARALSEEHSSLMSKMHTPKYKESPQNEADTLLSQLMPTILDLKSKACAREHEKSVALKVAVASFERKDDSFGGNALLPACCQPSTRVAKEQAQTAFDFAHCTTVQIKKLQKLCEQELLGSD